MSGDEEETHGFMDVTHNVACCISPEELARRIREAKIEGAKDALEHLSRHNCPPDACQYIGCALENNCADCWLLTIREGDWPPKEE